jgi:hypothetical protein
MVIVFVVGDVDSVDKKIFAHRRDAKILKAPHIGFTASFWTLNVVDNP